MDKCLMDIGGTLGILHQQKQTKKIINLCKPTSKKSFRHFRQICNFTALTLCYLI